MVKSAIFKTIMPRLSIKYALVEVLGFVSNMPRSIPDMPRQGNRGIFDSRATEAYLIARPTFISRLLVLLGVILVPVLHGRCFRSVFRNESTITTGAYSSTLREFHACWLSAMRHSRTRLKKNTLIEVSA